MIYLGAVLADDIAGHITLRGPGGARLMALSVGSS